MKACLSNQRFQESDCLRPDWRLVLVHQATPKLPKITLEGFIMRLLILSSVLSISALIRKASAPGSYAQMETLLVTTANGDDYEAEFKSLEASYSEDVDTRGATWATKYILEVTVKGGELMF